MTPRPALRLFPTDDDAFETFARAALADLLPTATPEDLQAALRTRYPAAVVRSQNVMARVHGDLVWYAFRYGSARGTPSADVGWDQPGVAVGVINDERRFVAVDERLAEIVEVPAEQIVGRPVVEFVNPADPTAEADLLGLWEQFQREGQIEATIRFNFRDGRYRELAYRLVRDGAGSSRHRLDVRVIRSDPSPET